MNSFNKRDYLRKKVGTPLIIWGLINTLLGTFYFFLSSEIIKGVIIQSFFWGIIDLFIGLYAFFNKKEQNLGKIVKIFLINTFLDIGYIIAGITLVLFSFREVLVGSGYGVIIQGAFLFIADLIHYMKLRKNL
jgi:hypothetical protein